MTATATATTATVEAATITVPFVSPIERAKHTNPDAGPLAMPPPAAPAEPAPQDETEGEAEESRPGADRVQLTLRKVKAPAASGAFTFLSRPWASRRPSGESSGLGSSHRNGPRSQTGRPTRLTPSRRREGRPFEDAREAFEAANSHGKKLGGLVADGVMEQDDRHYLDARDATKGALARAEGSERWRTQRNVPHPADVSAP